MAFAAATGVMPLDMLESILVRSNITMLRWIINEGYADPRTLERRAQKMEEWLANPELMRSDADTRSTVLSTSTRNFPNRLGVGANVYLTSAELAAVGAVVGRIQTADEYMEYASKINAMSGEVFRYLNFDKMPNFKKAEEEAKARIIPTLNVA